MTAKEEESARAKGKERDMSVVSLDSPKPRAVSVLTERLTALKNAIEPETEVRLPVRRFCRARREPGYVESRKLPSRPLSTPKTTFSQCTQTSSLHHQSLQQYSRKPNL